MKNLPLNPELFITNRKRFLDKMKRNSIAVFVSNDEVPSNGDALYPFKQNSDLYWLSGIAQEDSMVILFPDNPDPKYREVLVLVRPNELKEKWDGKRLRKEEATAISGIQTIVWLDTVEALLQTWVHLADTIYLDTNENDRKASWIRTRDYRFVDEMKSRYPLHQYERAAKILKELRSIKTKFEIEVTQIAIGITHNAFCKGNEVCEAGRDGIRDRSGDRSFLFVTTCQRGSLRKYHRQRRQGQNLTLRVQQPGVQGW